MLVVDEVNSPVAARRARSPHPDQCVRRCRRSGYPVGDRHFTTAADIDHCSAESLNLPNGRGAAGVTTADPGGTTRCRVRPAVRVRATGHGGDRR